jgi:hypothetical protein
MAAPQFVPTPVGKRIKAYESNDHVPEIWKADRPAELSGRQPKGTRLGYQGPDQGYAIGLANRFEDRITVVRGESKADAIRGCLNIALRRASIFGRAPMVHDLTIAFTSWGFLDTNPPDELVAARRAAFTGVANASHHYDEGRAIVDAFPEETLRLSHTEVTSAYAAGTWKRLLGLV